MVLMCFYAVVQLQPNYFGTCSSKHFVLTLVYDPQGQKETVNINHVHYSCSETSYYFHLSGHGNKCMHTTYSVNGVVHLPKVRTCISNRACHINFKF